MAQLSQLPDERVTIDVCDQYDIVISFSISRSSPLKRLFHACHRIGVRKEETDLSIMVDIDGIPHAIEENDTLLSLQLSQDNILANMPRSSWTTVVTVTDTNEVSLFFRVRWASPVSILLQACIERIIPNKVADICLQDQSGAVIDTQTALVDVDTNLRLCGGIFPE